MSKNWVPKFVGRENELRQLNSGLTKAREGAGKIIFITGEAGVGKTRLALELAKSKDDLDFEFLMGQCIYRDGTDPYLPFIDMFKGYLSEHPYLARAIQASLRSPGLILFDFFKFDERRYSNVPSKENAGASKNGKKTTKKSRTKKHEYGPYSELTEDYVISYLINQLYFLKL